MNSDSLVELEAFFPTIEPELPRCPTPVIEDRIRDAIIESCERANIWRWGHPEIPLIAGVQSYTLLTPTVDTLIHSILGVKVGGRNISGCNDAYTHEVYAGPDADFEVGNRGCIRLSAMPTKSSSPIRSQIPPPAMPVEQYNAWLAAENRPDTGIELLVSIKPSRTTLEVSAVLVRDYYNLICTGALAKALMMLNRPWSNPEMGKEKEKKYEFALAKAKQAIDRGFRTSSQRIKPRKFV